MVELEVFRCESCGAPANEIDYICGYCGCTFKRKLKPVFDGYSYSSSCVPCNGTYSSMAALGVDKMDM